MEKLIKNTNFSDYYNEEEQFENDMMNMIKTFVEDYKKCWFWEDLEINKITMKSWIEKNLFDWMEIEVKVSGKNGAYLSGADKFEYEIVFDKGEIIRIKEKRSWSNFSETNTIYEKENNNLWKLI